MNRFYELSGGAQDTLFALFFRGALPSGDLPAKSGAAELRDRGLAETGHTAIAYQGEDYFTWLTSAGQKFCIEHFVKSHSGTRDISYMFKTPPGDRETSHEGHLCGNTIEQETLSSVLEHYLPTTNLDKASEHAVKLASAVKASFSELDRATGGYVINQPDGAFIASGKITAEGILASTIKPGADGEGKQASTITVKINVDASEAMKSLDELGSMAKKIGAIVAEALQKNGSIFSAINQRERNAASHDYLSARVSALENCVSNQTVAIADLGARITKFGL